MAFGAHIDAYKHKWTGFSQALPHHDAPSLEKATKWAMLSAREAEMQDQPMATVLYLPKGHRSPGQQSYKKWIKAYPEYFTHIVSIKGPCPMDKEEQWTQGSVPVPKPNWSMEIIVAWNQQARRLLGTESCLGSLGGHIKTALASATTPGHTTECANLQGAWWSMEKSPNLDDALRKDSGRPPRTFRGADMEADLDLPVLPTTALPADEIMHHYSCDQSRLRHAWREYAYTDGSCIDVQLPGGGKCKRIGAGVYIPSAGHGKDERLTVDPAGRGPTNTINRAELSGIWAAMQAGHRRIATDSATSLYQIRKALLSPMDLRYHKHRELLELIVATMRTMTADGSEIHLFKVRAHNGDIGNELVDEVAKRAAVGDLRHDITVPTPAEPSYTSNYWPHTRAMDEDTQPVSMENLTHALKAHMHSKHRLGRANTESIYYQSWQRIKPMADTTISASFLTHAAITHAARKTALNWRFGTLWSNKMAFRCQQSNTMQCPLCGLTDGGEHISGGCRHASMERMYTERHNSTGRIVLRAISKGNMGADLVMADLGSAEKCETDGAPVLPLRHVPEDMLPPQLPVPQQRSGEAAAAAQQEASEAGGKKKLQPDAMIVQNSESGEKHEQTIYIIEFKYCRDTKPEAQLQACHAQHQELIEKLVTTGTPRQNIKLIPILIGHSGTVYIEHTLRAIEMLGVTAIHARKCATKMHVEAIRQLHSIVKTRRYLEHLAPGNDNGKTKTRPRQDSRQRGVHKQNFRPP